MSGGRICSPSTAPSTWGKFRRFSNPLPTILPHSFLFLETANISIKTGVQLLYIKLNTYFLSFMFLWPCIVSKSWRKNTNIMQQYRWFIVNCRCWLLTNISTCFEHLYAHHQEKRPRVTAYGVYLLVVLDLAGCSSVVLRWGCEHCEGCCRVWALWRLL